MSALPKSVKTIIANGCELLRRHEVEEFHLLFDKAKDELKKNREYRPFIGLLAAIQSEEYYNLRNLNKTIEMIEEASSYDDHYLYLFFKAILYEEAQMGIKLIPVYEELLLRDEERGNLPEALKYFILNNIAGSWYHLQEKPEWHKDKYGADVHLDYAIEHYLKVLDAPSSIKNSFNFLIANACNGIGYAYAMKKEINEALEYFSKSLDYSKHLLDGYAEIVITSLNGSAWCEYNIGNFSAASHLYTKANRVAITFFGLNHKVTNQLNNNLGLTWKERMGFEETGLNQIKLAKMSEKRSNQRMEIKSSSSFYYNPKEGKNKDLQAENKIAELKARFALPLNITEDISQKILPLKTFLPSVSTVRLQEFGWSTKSGDEAKNQSVQSSHIEKLVQLNPEEMLDLEVDHNSKFSEGSSASNIEKPGGHSQQKRLFSLL